MKTRPQITTRFVLTLTALAALSVSLSSTPEAKAASFTATGPMSIPRFRQTATLLPNGQVLVVGGTNNNLANNAPASAELYDPTTGAWTAGTHMLNYGRDYHTATLLMNGQVLVGGGVGASGTLASAELYNPATGMWLVTGGMTARKFHTATLLPNGKVLVVGGTGSGGTLASAEVYDPNTQVWTATPLLHSGHDSHTATLLPNGKVLV